MAPASPTKWVHLVAETRPVGVAERHELSRRGAPRAPPNGFFSAEAKPGE
jgi:hypothetical protein